MIRRDYTTLDWQSMGKPIQRGVRIVLRYWKNQEIGYCEVDADLNNDRLPPEQFRWDAFGWAIIK